MIVWLARPLEQRAYLNDEYFDRPDKARAFLNEKYGPLTWYRANELAWVGYKTDLEDEYVVWGYEVN